MGELANELTGVVRIPRRRLVSPAKRRHADGVNASDFSDRAILNVARRHGPQGSLLITWVRQRMRERAIRRRNIEYRSNDDRRVHSAYGAMEIDEFADINSLQAWANWRTIPRALRGIIGDQPVRAIDLCCGVGQSTEVLAFYLPPGSSILGLDGNQQFIAAASLRPYVGRAGQPTRVSFRVQSVLETFCDESGQPIADASIDLVHAVGAIGSHFCPKATIKLARECGRVVRSGGAALLDAGREGTPEKALRSILRDCGFEYVQKARSCCLDQHWQLSFQKA